MDEFFVILDCVYHKICYRVDCSLSLTFSPCVSQQTLEPMDAGKANVYVVYVFLALAQELCLL
jgi:hypothetical protein